MLIKLNPLFIWARSSINRHSLGEGMWSLVRARHTGEGALEVVSWLHRGHYCDGSFPVEKALGKEAACTLLTSAPQGQHSPSPPVPKAKPAGLLLFPFQLHFLWDFIVRVLPYDRDVLDSEGFRQQINTMPCLFNLKAFLGSVQHQILARFSESFPLVLFVFHS